MKKFAAFFASCFALTSAHAQYAVGTDFVVTRPTEISALGAYDGGVGFTDIESVGIFSDLTGSLVGPEVVFGPDSTGTQIGQTFYESFTPFTLSPGDYSVITISTTEPPPPSSGENGGTLSGGNSYQNLGNDITVPGGQHLDSGTGLTVSPSAGSNNGGGNNALPQVVDPVPDGGLTAVLLSVSLGGLGWMRRKL